MNAVFRGLQDALGWAFGPIMGWIFDFVQNYGLAIVIFTLICRVLALPFAVKQQRNMAKNSRMTMKLRKITERYKDDRRRQQEETQKFYQREGYNPMKAGCSMGMLLQMPIMIGLFAAINRVLRYTVRVPQDIIERLAIAAESILEGGGMMGINRDIPQIELRITENIGYFRHLFGEGYAYICDGCAQLIDYCAQLADYCTGAYESFALIPEYWFYRIEEFAEGFSMFGLQMGLQPGEGGSWLYWLVPVFAGIAALLTSLFTFFRQRDLNPQTANQGKLMTGCMTFVMPLFSAVWAVWFPVGVGLFWIVSGLIAFVQTVALHYAMPPQKMLARVLVEETVDRRSRENSKKKIAEL